MGEYSIQEDGFSKQTIKINYAGGRAKLSFPDAREPFLTDRLLYRVYDLPLMVDGETRTLDLYVSLTPLIVHHLPLFSSRKTHQRVERSIFSKGMVKNDSCLYILMNNLTSIEKAADQGSIDSRIALNTLLTALRDGQKMAFVATHGGTDKRVPRSEEWRVLNEYCKLSAPAAEVIADLSSRQKVGGGGRYSLIYINACNPKGTDIDLASIGAAVPTIIHTSNNVLNAVSPAKLLSFG